MFKRFFLLYYLLSMVVVPVMPSVNSSRYIRLHGTESSKMKKRLRSIELLPIQASLNIEANSIEVSFFSVLNDVEIQIVNCNTGNIVYNNQIFVDDINTLIICLDNFEEGEYKVEFIFEDQSIIGDFYL